MNAPMLNFQENGNLIKKISDFLENIENYPIDYCRQIADCLAQWRLDEITLGAGLLYKIPEKKPEMMQEIKNSFGDEIYFLINGIAKLNKIKYTWENEFQAENLRKMILALAQDLRIIFVKLASQLVAMKKLHSICQPKFQFLADSDKKMALETYEIYSPLAYRLGMQNLSGELEDLAFPCLYPQEYQNLVSSLKEHYEKKEIYLKKVKKTLIKYLTQNNIKPIEIKCRVKRYASVYKKLQRGALEKIYDLIALRLIVKNVEDCYTAFSLIHKRWTPSPDRIKDYIALPKLNGYRSLHTSVLCLENKIVEIQIRTPEMDLEAENGAAANWAYQQHKYTKNYLQKKVVLAEMKDRILIDQLRRWQSAGWRSAASEELLRSLKIDFFKDKIFAITPKGEIIELPAGATPVDFAYHIHSDIGNQCVGALVNDSKVPLDSELHSGDTVKIIIQKGKKPSADWLNFVKTVFAKKQIKSALKR